MQTERMTDSFRDHIANVLQRHIGPLEQIEAVTEALLDDPNLREIIAIAVDVTRGPYPDVVPSPEVRAILAEWRDG